MYKCPNCKNKGWKPDELSKKPVQVAGTDYVGSMVLRYRYCMNCGYKFKTREVFDSEVKPAPDLFGEEIK
ncbi:MAG: hypothetical protein RLN90_09620 [Balneolaceae bacterium]